MSFRGITFKSLRDGIMEDLNYAAAAQTAEIKAKVTSHVNTALDMAYPWLACGWPELRAAASQSVTGQAITLASITSARFGVSKVLGVSKNHPWKSSNPEPREWNLTADGITLDETVTDTTLYVAYVEAPPVYSSTAWVTATAYVAGDVVFETANCYLCLTGHTSGTFATDLAAAKWLVLPVPAFLHVPVRTAVGAAMALCAGQVETMKVLRQIMEQLLGEVALRHEAARN